MKQLFGGYITHQAASVLLKAPLLLWLIPLTWKSLSSEYLFSSDRDETMTSKS
jgi:hypothetical protein